MIRHVSASRVTFLAALAIAAMMVCLPEDAQAKRCGTSAPEAKQQFRKGGEGVPPLPLPATPLRRSEKKRPPSPPILVGKLEYGKIVWDTDANGQKFSYRDWTTDPVDIEHLLQMAGKELGINYRTVAAKFEAFSFDPQEIPILYLTGHERLDYPPEIKEKLRWYLNDGGYLIADACCGAKEFSEGFMALMKDLFPDRPPFVLPPDHPLYRCYHKIDQVGYQKDGKPEAKNLPYLLGVNIGCRTAVILSPFDVSCAWDGHPDPQGEGVVYEDGRKLGVNMIAYALANYRLGRFFSTQEVYYQEGQPSRDRLVIGQVIHNGDWDPTPKGVVNLLKYTQANSTTEVQFKRTPVALDNVIALNYPILYMTGHLDFKLSDAERAGLRNYLRAGGVLLADACCGQKSFDSALRSEIKQVLPEFELQPIATSHPLLSSAVDARQVSFSGQLAALQPDLKTPQLEGISMGGRLVVVYSKYGLGTNWDGMARPYSLSYSPEDSLKIGMDVLAYVLTH
jgi:hypothetical protein